MVLQTQIADKSIRVIQDKKGKGGKIKEKIRRCEQDMWRLDTIHQTQFWFTRILN